MSEMPTLTVCGSGAAGRAIAADCAFKGSAVTLFDFILHGSGMISSFNAFSAEKLLIDDETIGMLRVLRTGLDIGPKALALEVISAVGPGGNYLLESHTVEHCRDAERPSFFNRRKHDTWERNGSLDVVARASIRVRALLEEYQAPELDPETARRLREYARSKVA